MKRILSSSAGFAVFIVLAHLVTSFVLSLLGKWFSISVFRDFHWIFAGLFSVAFTAILYNSYYGLIPRNFRLVGACVASLLQVINFGYGVFEIFQANEYYPSFFEITLAVIVCIVVTGVVFAMAYYFLGKIFIPKSSKS